MAGNMLGGEAFAKMAAMAAIGAGSAGFKFDNLDAFIGSAKKGLEQAQAAVGGAQGKVMLGTTLGSAILNAAGVQVSPESILSRGLGVIPNSNMERLFNGVALRDFNFSWKMSPRDEEEAKQVKAIIRFFKQGMAARRAQEQTLFLGSPNVFRLRYLTGNNDPIRALPRYKICALTSTEVDYAPGGLYQSYEDEKAGSQPTIMNMTLNFTELTPIFEQDYRDFSKASQKDLFDSEGAGGLGLGAINKINSEDVGF